jgi:DMSO/TMAO reductase YedYZ heme-binding membrane subunit
MSARNGQLRNRRRAQPVVRASTARLVVSSVIIAFFAAGIGAGYTKTGAVIAASVLQWLTYYAGVLALIGLTAAVGAGLVATDRIFMTPGHRILAQAVHRALAFVGTAFLLVHITTEVIVGRSAAIDSVIPFLAKGRTFYVGVGTIASDLFILIIATGVARKRFVEKSTPLRWRVLHGAAYLAWPLAIIHGLTAGRQGKPYVDWSYGACMIAVGVALVLRSVATVRPKHDAAHAWPDEAGFPIPAAALAAAQAYVLRSQALGGGALTAGMPTALPVGTQAALPAGPSAAQSQMPRPGHDTGQYPAMYPAIPPAGSAIPDVQPTGPISSWPDLPGSSWPDVPGHTHDWVSPPRQHETPSQRWETPEWEAAEWEARWQQPAQWAQTPPEGMPLTSRLRAAGYAEDQIPRPIPPEQPPARWDWAQAPAREMGLQAAPRRPVAPQGPATPNPSAVPHSGGGSWPQNGSRPEGASWPPGASRPQAPLQGHVMQSGPPSPVPPEQPPVTWEQTPAYGMLPVDEPPVGWAGR